MNSEPGMGGRADSTSLFVGAIVALATIAIGTGLVFVASSGASRDGADVALNAAGTSESSTTTRSSASSTTTTTSGSGSGLNTTTTTPGFGSGSGPGSNGVAPPGRAVADPDDDPYEPVPLPAGVGATLDSCNWSSANGGELQSTGTISATPETDDVWFVDVYWLQNNRELDSQTEVIELDPGTSQAWRLTISAPLPPLDLRCALEIS